MGQEVQQFLCKGNRRQMGKSGKNDLFQLKGLFVYLLSNIGMRMTVEVNPPATDGVNVFPPVLRDQDRGAATFNRNGWRCIQLLGKRMPNGSFISKNQAGRHVPKLRDHSKKKPEMMQRT